jgi:hypothetical protein
VIREEDAAKGEDAVAVGHHAGLPAAAEEEEDTVVL